MTTKAQRELGISSNMSDEKLRRLFGGKSLQDIIKIKPSTGPSQSVNSWLQSEKKKKKKKKSKKA